MDLTRLNRMLAGLVLALVPLGAAGCCPPSYPQNEVVSVSAEVYQALSQQQDPGKHEELCHDACKANGYVQNCSLMPGHQAVNCSVSHPQGCGRAPAGLLAGTAPIATPGDWLAAAAQLEAASVHAFATLAAELGAHGAPHQLVAAAGRARADELRHARVMGALARRHGGAPRAAEVAVRPLRGLGEVALENGVEGCVRESYGAFALAWQAAHAGDPVVRRALGAIARDEVRHAALAWAVRAWAWPQLDGVARGQLQEAEQVAVAELAAECRAEVAPALGLPLGLPSAADAGRLHGALAERLWS